MPRSIPLLCLVALVGCRPADEVRTYTVPKPKDAPAAPSAPPGPVGDTRVYYVDVSGPTDRLLGAFVPSAAGGFYSLKLSGPSAAVGDLASAFRTLAESVRLTANPADPLAYSLPAGWKVKPGNQMRLATLAPGAGLPEVGVFPSFGGSLLENVNRWRGQVGAAPVTEGDLTTAAPELPLAGPPK